VELARESYERSNSSLLHALAQLADWLLDEIEHFVGDRAALRRRKVLGEVRESHGADIDLLRGPRDGKPRYCSDELQGRARLLLAQSS
jgi:hypothetical protein